MKILLTMFIVIIVISVLVFFRVIPPSEYIDLIITALSQGILVGLVILIILGSS